MKVIRRHSHRITPSPGLLALPFETVAEAGLSMEPGASEKATGFDDWLRPCEYQGEDVEFEDTLLDPQSGAICDSEGTVHEPSLYPTHPRDLAEIRNRFNRPVTQTIAQPVYSAGRHYRSYFHFMVNTLPAIREAALDQTQGWGILTGTRLSAWQRNVVRRLKIDPAQFLIPGATGGEGQRLTRKTFVPTASLKKPRLLRCRRLRFPARLTEYALAFDDGFADLVRDLKKGMSTASTAPRLIFVSRRGATRRPVANEAEMAHTLVKNGFAVFDPPANMSLHQQMQFFSRAQLVVGAHGAGLLNLVFAPQGCILHEIIPPHYIRPHFFYMAMSLGYRYAATCGRRFHRPDSSQIESPSTLLDPAQKPARLSGGKADLFGCSRRGAFGSPHSVTWSFPVEHVMERNQVLLQLSKNL